MRFSLFAAGLAVATVSGCCHSDKCQQDDRGYCEQGCRHGGNGRCFQGGCRPNCPNGNCTPECPEQPCIPPGKVRIKKPSPPPPVDTKPMPKPKPQARKPKPIRNVTFKPKSKFGRAKDFSWIVGQLRRVHVNGGSWKLRYAPLDVQDKWGGSVILSQDVRIEKFKDGDFVYVEGEILATRPTVYLAGPLYRISLIRKATDADTQKAWSGRLQNSTIRR